MNSYGEGPRTRTIGMVSDGSVRWNMSEIPSAEGKVYHDPDLPVELVQDVIRFSGIQPAAQPEIGSGEFGTVYDHQGYAVKRFHYRPELRTPQVETVCANIELQVGLDRIGPLEGITFQDPIPRTYDVSAPRVLAAFVPYRHRDERRTVMLMEQIDGVEASSTELPVQQYRMDHYSRAIEACGGNPIRYDFDDYPHNILVTGADSGGTTAFAKFDIMAL